MIFSKRASITDTVIRYAAWLFLAVLAVNILFPDPREARSAARTESAYASENYEKSTAEAFAILSADPMDIRKNREYLIIYNKWKQKWRNSGIPLELIAKYEAMTASKETRARDLGAFGVGFIYLLYKDYDAAIINLEKVSDKKMPFLNNALGMAYYFKGNYEKSLDHDYKEIAANPDFKGAYQNLGITLHKTRNYSRLTELLKEPKAAANISDGLKVYAALHQKDYWNFIRYSIVNKHLRCGPAGLAGNLLLLYLWVCFIRRLDIFKPGKIVFVIVMLALSMTAALFTSIGYDLMSYNGFESGGEWKNDLLYCVFGIGLMEEAIKLLPFLIFLSFTHRIDDTIDYITYPSLAGIGFAFIENLTYFDDQSLALILPRALTGGILHISLTVLAAYGLYAAKYKKKLKPVSGMFFYFSAAVILHGLADFLIIANGLPDFLSAASILILLVCMLFFAASAKTAIESSKHFDAQKPRPLGGVVLFLIDSLFILASAQYAVLGYKFGSSNANAFLTGSAPLIFFYILIILQTVWIINIKISKDRKTMKLPEISELFK